jgi:hypothetical protein
MSGRKFKWKLLGIVAVLASGLVLVGGEARAASIGGTDAQSQYTGFSPLEPDSGVLTFDDTLNGSNAAPEPGTVTTADGPGLSGLIGSVIDLELMLDTSGYDPATGALLDATFVGTGPAPEILIWDAGKTTVLLALDVGFVNVVQANPLEFAPPRGSVTLGSVQVENYGVESALTVVGGTYAAAVGGTGTGATLQLLIADPLPDGIAIADLLSGGFWNESLTVGFNTNPTSAITWEINFVESVPEPATTVLVGAGLIALAAARRRTG